MVETIFPYKNLIEFLLVKLACGAQQILNGKKLFFIIVRYSYGANASENKSEQ